MKKYKNDSIMKRKKNAKRESAWVFKQGLEQQLRPQTMMGVHFTFFDSDSDLFNALESIVLPIS